MWSVRALTLEIAARLEQLGRVAVEGEVSQVKQAASGHIYFSLKELDVVLSCVVWRTRAQAAVRGGLREGDRVVCHGKLDVYPPRGSYSLVVDRVEPRGLGALLIELERLKSELREKGWFDRQRPLPRLPRMVGVVTSRDGAAFQDFLRTRSQRWPLYPVRLAHAPVQGVGAAERIAAAIRRLASSGVEVVVVCRGGGSLEDLWAFNELAVARAIHECPVPVVSGVGHETDVTLSDLVADHRAHTPTDAAALVLPDRSAWLDELERHGAWLSRAIEVRLERATSALARFGEARVLRSPEWILADRARELARAGERARRAVRQRIATEEARLARAAAALRGARPEARLDQARARLVRAGDGLANTMRTRLAAIASRLDVADAALRSTSPFAVLERGYSITLDADGRAVRDAAAVSKGVRLTTRLHRGELDSVVEQVRPARPAAKGDPEPAS